jgi:hypothetical protein
MTVEQQLLMKAIVERVGEIQSAVQRAMPSNQALHAEFFVGGPAASTASEAARSASLISDTSRFAGTRQLTVSKPGSKIARIW